MRAARAKVVKGKIVTWAKFPEGTKLLNELTLGFAAIASNPEVGRKVPLRAYPDARTYVLRRTRYVVIYNIDSESEVIAVTRVRHGNRRPLARTKKR